MFPQEHELLHLGTRGLIPGPKESGEEFLRRSELFKAQKQTDRESLEKIKDLFLVHPDWIGVEFSNRGLLPWQGGCTYLGENASLQVRKAYSKQKKLFWIYSKEEIIAHELVHMARMAFEEPLFEEILAYQTSPSKFRRFFGPLFRSSKESIFFMVLFPLMIAVNLLYALPLATFTTLFGVTSVFVFRLWKSQKIFSKARFKGQSIFNCEKKALSFLLRLTDREIILFSRLSLSEIGDFATQAKETSLRWRQIYLTFFNKKIN